MVSLIESDGKLKPVDFECIHRDYVASFSQNAADFTRDLSA